MGGSGRQARNLLPRITIFENVAPRPDKRFERQDASRNGLARDAPATFMRYEA